MSSPIRGEDRSGLEPTGEPTGFEPVVVQFRLGSLEKFSELTAKSLELRHPFGGLLSDSWTLHSLAASLSRMGHA